MRSGFKILDYLDMIVARTVPCFLQQGEHFPLPESGGGQMAFVVSGVLRNYVVDETGRESVIMLPAEGAFISSLKKGSVDIHRKEALTNVVLLTWRLEDFEELVKIIPHWYALSMLTMKETIDHILIERGAMLSLDATTRYRKFVERYPTIVERVQLRHVASYLGIAPQSLSRIRKQLSKR